MDRCIKNLFLLSNLYFLDLMNKLSVWSVPRDLSVLIIHYIYIYIYSSLIGPFNRVF